MTVCAAEVPNGNVYFFNGYNRVRKWDGITNATELAGLEGPTTPISLGESGDSGSIIGQFYAYVRFVDRYGNFSNVSPISNALDPRVEVGNGITGISNASPMVVTTAAAHGLGTGQIVQISGAYGNDAANDYWTVTVLSATTFELDESTGNGTYNSGGKVYTGTNRIIYGNVEVPTDDKVVRRQILRNQDGDVNTFYVDVDTEDLTSTTFESSLTSSDLAGQTEVPAVDDAGVDQILSRYTVPPDQFACVAQQGGRLFACVIEPYSEGSVSMTVGSRSVTGIGVKWNPYTFAGRVLTIRGQTRQYAIESVQSETLLTLVDPYEGSTDPYARYTITPTYESRRSLRWSEPGLYEAWPPGNVRLMPEDPGSGDVTGIFAQTSFIFITSEYTTMRFSFYKNPNLDGGFSRASERGCVNNRCAVSVGDVTYCLDYLGVHAWAGNDDDPTISAAIRDLFKAEPNSPYRINWRAKKYFHGVYSPSEGLIRWFVALGGEYTPRHALVCDFARKRWAIEKYAFPVGASCTSRMSGRPQVLYGTRAARILAADLGTMDGPPADAGTTQGTCSDAGPAWIEDDAAEFNADAVGFPVTITEGRGRGQQRLIHTVSGDTRLEVRPPWSVRPDTTSKYQVGGIPWLWRSGWFEWTQSPKLERCELEFMFGRLETDVGLSLRLFDDTQDDPLEASETRSRDAGDGVALTDGEPWLDVDATTQQGRVSIGRAAFRDPDSSTPAAASVEIAGCQGSERMTVWGLEQTGAQAT